MGSDLANKKTSIIMGEEEACSFAMSLTSASVIPMVLKAVLELDVLEIIKRSGPGAFLTPAQIAAQLSTKNPEAGFMLDRMLRLLASHSIVSCSTRTCDGQVETLERCYGLNPVCRFFTKDENGVTLGALALVMQDNVIMESWYHLKDAVLEGGSPFERAHNMTAFEYFGMDSRFNKIFNNGMANHSIITLKKIIENYKGFERISTLVDIGGGNGATLDMIISKYPNIRGINLDLPHVLANAPTYHGVEHVSGDMFVSIPKGDAMFMKWIAHDWSDEHCMKLFKNCYDSLPDEGKVIVCEYIVPIWPENSYAAKTVFQCDVLMMTTCLGGKERTLQEFEVLAKAAGFEGLIVACCAFDTKVIEFIKKPRFESPPLLSKVEYLTPGTGNNEKKGIVMGEEEACSFAMTLASASVVPMILNTVIELDVLEIIKRAGSGAFLTSAQIAAQLSTTNPEAGSMLDRMLRLLASHSVVSCSIQTILGSGGPTERCYGLTPVCEFLTKDENGVTLADMCLAVHDKANMEKWYHLKDAVLGGGSPFKRAHDMTLFEYLGTDSRFNRIFNNGMASHSTVMLKKIIEKYEGFNGISTLVDVGGGNGTTLHMIISKYPNLKGINFDLPHVLANAPTYIGVEHVPGDMFVSIPKGDAIFMKWIAHDWSDEHCMKLFQNCYVSLPDKGKVIICDYILPVTPESSYAAKTVIHYDVLMMATCPGGKERTLEEFEVLAKAAGFECVNVVCSAYDTKLIEFIKKI